MTATDILARLADPTAAVELLLEECRAVAPALFADHPELVPIFVEQLLKRGHPGRALDLAHDGRRHLRGNARLEYQLALAAARGGNPRYAEELLAPLLELVATDDALPAALRVDAVALQGRVLKDRARREPPLAAEAARWYERAAELPGATDLPDAGTFPLVNAATLWRVAGDRAESDKLAAEVVRRVEHLAEPAAAAGDMWPAATLAEACILLGRHEEAVRWYQRAFAVGTARGEDGNIVTMRANLRLLAAAGATADLPFLDDHLGRVVVFSGHMIDSPDRRAAGKPPRFPNHRPLIDAVGKAIRAELDQLNAKVGYCSLACGADILFAEAMLDRGAELHVVLPSAIHDFLRESVNFGQESGDWRAWRRRFDAVLDRVEQASRQRVHYATREPYLGSVGLYDFTNKVLQGLAGMRAAERAGEPAAVAVIDRAIPGAAGGTADFLAAWEAAGHPAVEIDLAALRAKHPGDQPTARPAAPLPRTDLHRPVKAVLFADMKGYSQVDEWELVGFLADYGRYLKELFHSPTGAAAVYANTWGDAVYAVFDTATAAAAFACELTDPRTVRPPDWAKFDLGTTCPFRVGLHAGPVFELPDLFQGWRGFTGQHVNRAARIEPVTVRGCAYASEPFAALLTAEAGGRYAAEAVGVHVLAKEYDRCPLYRVTRAG